MVFIINVVDSFQTILDSISNDTLGLFLIKKYSDREYQKQLHEKAMEYILDSKTRGMQPWQQSIVLASLSFIALRYYNSGTLWEAIRMVYSDLYALYGGTQLTLENDIRTIIRCQSAIGSRSLIITPLMNAIVPAHYLPDFIDFLFDIYRINFDFCLPENLMVETEDIFDAICGMMTSVDDNDFQTSKKTYKLIISTKKVIQDNSRRTAIVILATEAFKFIDNWFYDRPNNSVFLDYFLEGLTKRNKPKVIGKQNREKDVIYNPIFRLRKNCVYLFFKIFKIRADISLSKLSVKVYNGTTLLATPSFEIKEIMLYNLIEVSPMPLENPIGKIKIVITNGETEIYNSFDQLYRDFFVI